MNRLLKISVVLIFLLASLSAKAQERAAESVATIPSDTIYNPDIIYSPIPKSYEIAGIRVEGVNHTDDYIIIANSGLSIGERVEVPGSILTSATKRLWRQGLYSSVKITADKIAGDKIWLVIQLKQQPRLSEIRFEGVKGGEKKDINERLGMISGQQITPNIVARATQIIKDYYAAKGFKNADVKINQVNDLSKENQVFLDVIVNKNGKVKVHKIYVSGNEVLSDRKVKNAMKKTNEKTDLLKLFSQKKFVDSDYKDDKNRIIEKYNSLGYRDARIVSDSIVKYDDNTVDVYLDVEEGNKYYISDINWVGNTVYSTDMLNNILGMYPGDVYNQPLLEKRLRTDEDAVSNYYLDNGYLFFELVPIEENIKGDSIALQLRVMEGPQATINKVIINGNDQLFEKVVRRELRVRPGDLFSKSDLMRSAREIATTGHFNPENMDIRPEPNENDGTVDILFNLESKANDKVQLSFGWGQTGVTGQVSLSFSNFSIKNLFNPGSYRGIIPRGDGQTFSISAQTNAKYYQSYSISFFDPWFGGKRPNALSFSVDYSRSTGINSSYYNNSWYNSGYYNSLYYGGSYNYNNTGYYYQNAYDPNKVLQMAGVMLGFGTRLSWPDDYFQFQASLSYRWYYLKNWEYLYYMNNGVSNSLMLGLSLSRTSIDQPIYPRRGSSFSVDVTLTPPASLFTGKKDWETLSKLSARTNTDSEQREAAAKEMYKWIEYWKVKFKSRT
ncbi:MAG: outer membrane protein assembly factor BamA, partial [Muribaculaceae bacterium]|nr:outer membrane protein assembly factor BamA [Muribaculaceae bacterium]